LFPGQFLPQLLLKRKVCSRLEKYFVDWLNRTEPPAAAASALEQPMVQRTLKSSFASGESINEKSGLRDCTNIEVKCSERHNNNKSNNHNNNNNIISHCQRTSQSFNPNYGSALGTFTDLDEAS